MAITGWNDQIKAEMEELVKPEYGRGMVEYGTNLFYASGINSFKFFLAYEGIFMVDDKQFYYVHFFTNFSTN